MPAQIHFILGRYGLSVRDVPLDPASHHGGPLCIRKVSMVWHNHILVVGVFLHVNEVLRIFEHYLNEAVIVCNVSRIQLAEDPVHHLLCLTRIVLLLVFSIVFPQRLKAGIEKETHHRIIYDLMFDH